ncbi:MAG: DciA family protein [Phycisphaerales bacterium JB038]
MPADFHKKDFAMGGVFAGMRQELERSYKRSGGFGKLWAELVPEHLATASTIQSYNRGVLSVVVRDAGSKYELDRLLRTGLEQQLRERAPATLKRVKLMLAG